MARLPSVRPSALWEAFAAVAARGPRRVVVSAADGDVTWTARELAERAEALAPRFAAARGGLVAFARPTEPGWLEDFLAMQRAGVAALALEPGADWMELARGLGAGHAWTDGALVRLGGTFAAGRFAGAKVTSGSTGRPALVPYRAEHLLADGRNIVAGMGIRAADRNLALLPLGHSYGLGNLVMPLILQGTALVTAAAWVPRQVPEWIAAHRVTVLPTVPVVLRLLAELPELPALPSLRRVISAGAVLPPEVARAFAARFGTSVRNFYGSSETGGICFDRTGAASRSGRAVGRPLPGVEVTVGRDGRIRVAGAAVTTRGGRFTLADVGGWTAAGELRILGRATALANVGGRKVSPLEVERVLRGLRGVTEAWVGVVPGEGRDYLVAAVESGRTDVRAELARRLPAWKRPRELRVAAELPRTARGKLDSGAIERWFSAG